MKKHGIRGAPHWPDTTYKNVCGCSNYTAHYLLPKLMLKWYVSLIHALTNIHQSHYHLKNSVVYNDQCLARPWLLKTFLDIFTTRKKRSNDKFQFLKTSKDFDHSHTRPLKGRGKVDILLIFLVCWWCNANGRSQSAFPFLHHKENDPAVTETCASMSTMLLSTQYKTMYLTAISSHCLDALPAKDICFQQSHAATQDC